MDASHRNYLPPEFRDQLPDAPDAPSSQPAYTPEHDSQPTPAPQASGNPDAPRTGNAKEHPLESISHWVSALFSPLLSGTYGVLLALTLSYLVYSPFKVKSIVLATTFVATCVLPVISIFLLTRTGRIADPSLNTRKDRTVPYIATALCYIGTGIYYNFVNAPVWLMMFMAGAGAALFAMAAINLRWKISAHACGTGALLALLFYMMVSGNSVNNIQWEFIAAAIIAGCVGSARIILNRHTPLQIGAGFLIGFICVFLPAWFVHA